VTWELAGMWLGKLVKESQIASSITWTHCTPWKL
jgi:hypothetical protein